MTKRALRTKCWDREHFKLALAAKRAPKGQRVQAARALQKYVSACLRMGR